MFYSRMTSEKVKPLAGEGPSMTNKPPELVIGDPHDQSGLVDHIPQGLGPLQIANFYHYHLWPQEKAYCAKCGAHRHRDGFTIELDDGTLALAGSTCAADFWGERWTKVRDTFQVKLHKAGIILDVRTVLSELESIRATLETDWRPVVDQTHALQKRFKGLMGALYYALRKVARQPDHSLDGRPIEGWAFFAADDVPQQFKSALDQIDAAIAAGHGHETELGVRTVNNGEARDRLDAIAHVARALRSFFRQEHLGWIVIEVNQLLRGRWDYPYAREGLSVMDLKTERSIGLPPDYPVINTDPLRRLCDLKP
jgi:hypothetical protein